MKYGCRRDEGWASDLGPNPLSISSDTDYLKSPEQKGASRNPTHHPTRCMPHPKCPRDGYRVPGHMVWESLCNGRERLWLLLPTQTDLRYTSTHTWMRNLEALGAGCPFILQITPFLWSMCTHHTHSNLKILQCGIRKIAKKKNVNSTSGNLMIISGFCLKSDTASA